MQIVPMKALQKYWEHVKRHWNLLKALSCPYLVSGEHQKKKASANYNYENIKIYEHNTPK